MRDPRLFFEDAVRKRIESLLDPADGNVRPLSGTAGPAPLASRSLLPRPNEHLMAAGVIGADASTIGPDPGRRVYLITDIPFWRNALGNQCRIEALARALRERYDLTVVYCSYLTLYDAKVICGAGWDANVYPLINAKSILEYERVFRQPSIKDPSTYGAAKLFAAFIEDHPCRALIIEYVRLEPLVRYLETPCLEVIDTHDVMSKRMADFAAHGREHHVRLSEQEEIFLLSKFDRVLAIQCKDAEFLRARMAPEKILLAPHSVGVRDCRKCRQPKRLVYIAGKNPANYDSIAWFLKRVWPRVGGGGLELHLYGEICALIKSEKHLAERLCLSVCRHGSVESQEEVYSAGDIVINPVLYGGGLKIKSIEAMAHGLPMVTTSEGARGLEECTSQCFLVADSPEEFASAIRELVADGELRSRLSRSSLDYARAQFSPESCYGPLFQAIDDYDPATSKSIRRALEDECPDSYERTLILGYEDFPLFWGSPRAIRKYRNRIFFPAAKVQDLRHFRQILQTNCIDRVLINNPYVSDQLLTLYRYAVAKGMNVTTFDRGALPDSWFFDNHGFNGDSSSYRSNRWDRELSTSEREIIERYISAVLQRGATLEKQGDSVGAAALKEELGISGKKVLFVPFQRPNDSVVKFLSKHVDGMDGFVEFLNRACMKLPKKDWVVLAKRHPLEIDDPGSLATMVPPSTHIHDLLDLADAVFTLNSGVGVQALLHNKPTFVCGESFYAAPGLAQEVSSPDALISAIHSGEGPSWDKILRFTHYLVTEFYSFGKARGYTRVEESGELSPITVGIDFHQIRGIG